ncbi:long-chain-fatty-acid--CoA ligase [Polyangium sp. 6x1]|uniref:long-chain-fatty-acid--CoA ligase n=1 Tax=Polyangium sp. 6x1 TaxID=3042689 RepID=UPI0024824836|nr:long-chain-fatty-acid--CoA ligase [Polyangium sp. 6x1]MDI1447981.1 long-chain-fatty-acid--CoA ligase [Polyangium sp. 6x1]
MKVPLLVNDFLRRASKLYPDKVGVIDGSKRFTYRQFHGRVNQLAHALRRLGVQKGDRVCMLSPNSHYFLEAFYGVSQIGAILVPLNYRLAPEEHAYIINHAGVKVVIADYDQVRAIEPIRGSLNRVEHFVVAGGAAESFAQAGWKDWDALTGLEPTTATPPVDVSEDDVFSINYTSGTTARPKGVMLTQRNCYLNALNLAIFGGLHHDDVELWTLPMFHASGWGGLFAITALAGTHVVLRAVVASDIFRLIADEKVTFLCGAPAVLSTIIHFADRASYDITTRPRMWVGGAPPPVAHIEHLEKVLGWQFIQIYGLTETSPIVSVNVPDFYNPGGANFERRGRAGTEVLGVDLQVVDEEGKPVPQDNTSIGEIAVRSSVVMEGYWNQPEETAKAIYDGYFHSGDLAVWDEHANVHIVDRKKDVIISGGENISSPEVEGVLYRHEAVLECAVIGVPSEKWGETPKAIVVLRAGKSVKAEELIAFTREHLAHYKCPTSIDFVPALPRTATGKLQKFVLREQYWKGYTRRVH